MRHLLLTTILLTFGGLTLAAQPYPVDFIPGYWLVGEQNVYGDVLPPRLTNRHAHYGFDFWRDGRMTYTSRGGQGAKFVLHGQWSYDPRQRLLIIDYYRKKGKSRNVKFKKRLAGHREVYFVERANPYHLVLRSRSGSRDFALVASE